MYVLACPGITARPSPSGGLPGSREQESVDRFLQRCRQFGIEVIPFPCSHQQGATDGFISGPHNGKSRRRDQDTITCDCTGMVRLITGKQGNPLCMVRMPVPTADPPSGGRCNRGDPECLAVLAGTFPDIPVTDVMTVSRYRVYLAAPLFSAAEKRFNRDLSRLLERHFFSVYLPQEVGDDTHTRDLGENRKIFLAHHAAFENTDLVVAVVDGADADSGTAWEMGYAYARGIPVIALRTDFRMAGREEHVNLMLEQSAHIVHSCEELVSVLTCRNKQGDGPAFPCRDSE